jgi:hypothetical protein
MESQCPAIMVLPATGPPDWPIEPATPTSRFSRPARYKLASSRTTRPQGFPDGRAPRPFFPRQISRLPLRPVEDEKEDHHG